MIRLLQVSFIPIMLALTGLTWAQMDSHGSHHDRHDAHETEKHTTPDHGNHATVDGSGRIESDRRSTKLERVFPASGESRETGYQGNRIYPVVALDDPVRLCRQGRAGLVMLDRQTWDHCAENAAVLNSRTLE